MNTLGPTNFIPYIIATKKMNPDPINVKKVKHSKRGGMVRTMYKSAFCQMGLLSTFATIFGIKSTQKNTKGASRAMVGFIYTFSQQSTEDFQFLNSKTEFRFNKK